ncbi:GAF domain-containing protein [Rhodohalobacter sp.]|uniref:GAF domain-containing protein n=1 Tax=Rhodohalobacter sp. TaxID=1974210 RepID=UPI002ACDFCCD|nr:GAF domain-containing protein [Rhodohalobacter sp.]MDZ7755381.1 histidine kinase dimerization/phosphoacceptor domain -containing protein [Rhodohalobacter sp.]
MTEGKSKSENLHKKLQKENLSLILETLEGINNTNEFKTVLHESMEATRQVMDSEASSLFLIDDEKGELFISVPTGPAEKEVAGKSIPKDKGIAGWVLSNQKPYLTNDVTKSEHFYGDLVESFTTKNLMCVPLINRHGDVIGIIQAMNKRDGKDYLDSEIPVFESLATHITIAIERTKKIDSMRDTIQQKDVMIAEIHHRVKNNLQALSEQIQKDANEIEDEKANELLRKIEMRMKSMAKLHDLLVEKKVNEKVDLYTYTKNLAKKIEDSMSFNMLDIQIGVSGKEITVSQNKALLCGLILNELLINVYKHAQLEGTKNVNEIEVSVSNDEGLVILSVADNGIGVPDDFSIQSKRSVGMWIVHELLQKLDADMTVLNDPGARFTITFPE